MNMNKWITLAILILFIYGCSDPQPCPELDFDTNNRSTYVNGEPYTGRCLTYKNENKRSIQQYLNGADHGRWIFYFENGEVETNGKFKNGTRVGVWNYYWPNGKARQISKYSSTGERRGTWKVYDSIGNLLSTSKY